MNTNYEETASALKNEQSAREHLAEATPMDLSNEDHMELAMSLLADAKVAVENASVDANPLVQATFAEAYERKGFAQFDSFADEHRNESYNINPETVVIQFTFVLSKGEHQMFSQVKAQGEKLKAQVTEAKAEAKRLELEEKLAKAKAEALEKELEAL